MRVITCPGVRRGRLEGDSVQAAATVVQEASLRSRSARLPERPPARGRLTVSRVICDHCADAIGVYEPVVVVVGEEARVTSRAAEPMVGSQPGERYHRACYIERFGPAPNLSHPVGS